MFERAHARLQAARNGEKGFTLIELMIVIVILGVLAGIVVFSVQFISNRGNQAACQTNVKNIQSAVEAYYAKFGNYPSAGIGTQADLTATPPNTNSLIGAGVLKDIPTDPNHTYAISGQGIVSSNPANCA